MYFDWTYFILVLPAMLFAMIASAGVNSTYAKYSKQYSSKGVTGAQAARLVLDKNGLYNIPIEQIPGKLTDHFDPTANVIRLSGDVYNGTSTASIGVACHEVGHAIQHAVGYTPIKIRSAIVPITNIGSKIAVPLIIIGILCSSLGEIFVWLAYIGLIGFALTAIFQLVTLPTEFNASSRALATIRDNNILTPDELKGARKVLSAAAMTYVAALAVAVAQLLRLIIIVNRRTDRR
ncbi:MAG: zinc metallopeptidase [Ruminococcaceae bacterium]|nr:zinc metallopeptidase [Oscillospiraceae bacterium]